MEEKKKKATDEKDGAFYCKYCQKPISKFDYESYHGICGKCREVADWKQILRQAKNKE